MEERELDSRPIVVLGAGAAGLMAAIFAATESAAGDGCRVLLLERTRDGGRKILVSGGGRCNVLPSVAAPERFVTESSPNTLRKMLLSWPLDGQRRFFEEEAGVPLALENETGKLFPRSNRASDVRDALIRLARRRGVEIRFGARVAGLERARSQAPREEPGGWIVRLEDGSEIAAGAVIVATGGLSMPGTGSDGQGLAWLRTLGLALHPAYPALTPLTAEPPVHADLAGISLEVALTAPGAGRGYTTRGGFLFTHRGYSGPAVLDISHLATRGSAHGGGERTRQPILAQWTELDGGAWEERLRSGSGAVVSALRRELPDRLADALLAEAGVGPERTHHQLQREERRRLVEVLARYPLPWSGDEGYRKAEVTGGGIALSEVDPRTLECRKHPGLFLCGEILDAFGPIGGHNFSWAWATGRAAGVGAARQERGSFAPDRRQGEGS